MLLTELVYDEFKLSCLALSNKKFPFLGLSFLKNS